MLDVALGRLVNVGWISQARELAMLFDHESTDLTIILVGDLHCSYETEDEIYWLKMVQNLTFW